jgi:hypothetical protein
LEMFGDMDLHRPLAQALEELAAQSLFRYTTGPVPK